MPFDKLIVTIFGFILIGFIYWFFFVKKEQETEGSDSINIIVEGGYIPDKISIKNNETTKLIFLRKDPSSCLEEVVLPDFKIRKYLPLNKKVTLEITPEKTGEYTFSCGMSMYHGKITVK